ncbi:Glycosyltransferase involved in cell wall bisynthesis [Asanoa hainanensis]|uniref:Glycosyltransferase involved in cell wall bisynthesis n=1 Tax=Asanoa hainanensis TaxID=560556 RepID=A0A239PAI6_9ACTN|nr:glycosyltransferase family 4 protein [Asanoa hainanensis]SNT63955.1 Glycosyltransferase involved in cell wall bisynthesis [Asanoa hainanensis]
MTDALAPHLVFLNWRDVRHPEGGGSEVYIERMAAELVSRGYRVTLFCQAHGSAQAREVKTDGVAIVRQGGRHTVYLRAALAYLAGVFGFGPLSRRGFGRPDLIVDVCNGLPFLSPLYSRRPVVTLVHHVHREQWPVVFGPVVSRIGWWVESRLAVRVYRNRRYVTVSPTSRRELVELGVDPELIRVVHNGTPEASGPPAPRTAHPSLLVLGRLVPHKRIELALRVTALLSPELPDLELVVAGRGWWEEPLRELAGDLGIEDRVRFTGFVTDEHKHELLCRSWLSLVPSLKEGWGLTIVEAGAHGTPGVAFRSAGGVADAIVDGETGILVHDEVDFLRAVRRLLRDPERRSELGVAAQKHAQQFTWAASGEAFAGVIAEQLRAGAAGVPGASPRPHGQRVP